MTIFSCVILISLVIHIVSFLKDSSSKKYIHVPDIILRTDKKDKELDDLIIKSLITEQKLKELQVSLSVYLFKINSLKTNI